MTDAARLLDFSKTTFFDFFGPLNDAANMEAYAAIAFTSQRMLTELIEPDSEFYFAKIGRVIVGYLKLNFNKAQTEFQDPDALEIERIYVAREHHGKKIGQKLLDFAIDTAIKKQLKYIWLGVWEHNTNALGFYRHNGFKAFSSHTFLLGNDKQTDLLMKKVL